jgi:hypothetical protein
MSDVYNNAKMAANGIRYTGKSKFSHQSIICYMTLLVHLSHYFVSSSSAVLQQKGLISWNHYALVPQ